MQINIGFGIDNSFSQHCGATIASILKNSSLKDNYRFFIIHKDISDENKAKFEGLKKIRDFEIEFVKIDDKILQEVNFNKDLAIEQSYRFFLFSFDCVDKLLYMDSDIIVRKDIAEVFNIDIEDYCLAAVEDVSSEYSKNNCNLSEPSIYVNSGFLLINLKKTREIDHFDFLQNLPEDLKKIEFSDQDVINYIYQEKILPIDIKYNFMYCYRNSYKDQEYYHKLAADPHNIHYLTTNKPWVPGSSPYRKEEYFKYLKLTPWYDEYMEMFRREENMAIVRKMNEMNCKFDDITGKMYDLINRLNTRR